MRKLAIAVGALALLGLGMPAMAHGWDGGWESPHDQEHEWLDEQHQDIHDQLDAEHAAAHEEGLSPWEHAQLHRELEWQHRRADRQLRREHNRWHNRGSWQWYSPYRPSYYGW